MCGWKSTNAWCLGARLTYSQLQSRTLNATMNHDPYVWGRPDDAVYGAYNHAIANASSHGNVQEETSFPKMNSQQPIITGTSVNSIKFTS